jgi:hypothetical protein
MPPIAAHDDYNEGRLPQGFNGLLFALDARKPH